MSRRRFTLIELLVVVAIISVLASLLLPALKRAREASKIAFCANNERQLILAVYDFVDDYNDYLPMSQYAQSKTVPYQNDLFPPIGYFSGTQRSWSNAPSANLFWPYYAELGEILCSTQPHYDTFLNNHRANVADRSLWWQPSGTYSMAADQFSKSFIGGSPAQPYVTKNKMSRKKRPSQLIAFLEQYDYPSVGRQYYGQRYYNSSSFMRIARYHNDRGSNALYFDGHVEYHDLPRQVEWNADYTDGCIQNLGFTKENWRNE